MISTGLTEQEKERLIKILLSYVSLNADEDGKYHYLKFNMADAVDKKYLMPGEEVLIKKAMDNLLKSVWGF